MQPALAHDPEERQPGPELVTAAAVPSVTPEQLPLIRMLEVVRDRVESIHAGQRVMSCVTIRGFTGIYPLKGS